MVVYVYFVVYFFPSPCFPHFPWVGSTLYVMVCQSAAVPVKYYHIFCTEDN
jgi:hypothetical protein